MTIEPRRNPRLNRAFATGIGIALIGGTVVAQTVTPPAIAWDARKLERLDRNVRKLERALTQRNAAGDPVIIEPDAEVVALMGRIDLMDRRLSDLESTLVRANGSLEDAASDLAAAQRANRDLTGRLDALTRRVAELEAARAEVEAAARSGGAPGGGLTPRSPSGSETGDFDAAMRLMRDGNYGAAGQAFELFIVTWPDSTRRGEAHYRLAETRFIAEDEAGAAQAYAVALMGWPTTPWAADATVKLAESLLATERTPQACQALGEFDRRYASGAAAAVHTRAQQVRARARCA